MKWTSCRCLVCEISSKCESLMSPSRFIVPPPSKALRRFRSWQTFRLHRHSSAIKCPFILDTTNRGNSVREPNKGISREIRLYPPHQRLHPLDWFPILTGANEVNFRNLHPKQPRTSIFRGEFFNFAIPTGRPAWPWFDRLLHLRRRRRRTRRRRIHSALVGMRDSREPSRRPTALWRLIALASLVARQRARLLTFSGLRMM